MVEVLLAGRVVVWMLAGYVLGLAILVSIEHVNVWKHRRTHLLPLHVWSVALSYSLLLVYVLTETGPLGWRAVIYIPGLMAGAVAMTVLVRHQRLVHHPDAEF